MDSSVKTYNNKGELIMEMNEKGTTFYGGQTYIPRTVVGKPLLGLSNFLEKIARKELK